MELLKLRRFFCGSVYLLFENSLLTISSIYTHSKTLKKNAFRKHCGKM